MKNQSLTKHIWHALRDNFLRGLLVVVPIGVTLWIVQFVYQLINEPSDQVLRWLISHSWLPGSDYFREHHGGTIPGGGFWVTLIFVLLVGIGVGNFLGRTIVKAVDTLFLKIPLVKSIYQALKQTMHAVQEMSGEGSAVKFNQMVLVPLLENHGTAICAVGFVTGRVKLTEEDEYCSVFLPNSPTPVTGFTLLIKRDALIWEHGLSVEEGLKFIISYGLATTLRKTTDVVPHAES
ncbi:MAG: DUF502 domain-containing protein [Verrucomicrobiae bacterium]|nr:DUF502 domain-containing protein [Verrucomicrobiae bacterium]